MSNTLSELDEVRHAVRRVLQAELDIARQEHLIDTPGSVDLELWRVAARQGWQGAALAEGRGGSGLGWAGLAVIAEELGRLAIGLPLAATALAADALLAPANGALAEAHLGALAEGRASACVAFGGLTRGALAAPSGVRADAQRRLGGVVRGVAFGATADLAIVAAAAGEDADTLWLVALDAPGVKRVVVPSIDNARGTADLHFEAAAAQPLAADGQALLARAALLAAFEQLGGAESALALAREHALQREAFGQPIARFQAIKHKLVEIYGAIEIARGCALSALAALEAETGDAAGAQFHERACAARLAATQAYDLAATDDILIHGAIGVTREAAPHRHYRRARALALELGAAPLWRNALVDHLAAHAFAPAPEAAAADPGRAEGGEDDLVAYRARARAWLAKHAPAHSGEARRGLSFDEDVALGRRWQALKAGHGYACITLPRRYGGGGGTELQKLVFGEEELRYDLPLQYLGVSISNPVPMMLNHASEAFRERLGPPAIRGDEIWCQMFSEPSAGSDLAALRTRAERDGDGWRINGQKVWTSWAQLADWGVIVLRTDPTVSKHAGLSYFFIDMHSPGITVRPIRRLGGEHDLNEVFLDNVHVPDTQRLGKVGDGFKLAIETLMIERYGVVDESGYAPTLEAFARLARHLPLGGGTALDDGEVRARLALASVERIGLRNIHQRAVAAMAAGREPGPEGSIRKLLLGRTRHRLASLALDLQGPAGVRRDADARAVTDFAQAWLDPALRIAGGTDEVLLNTLAERVLGLPQDHRPDKGKPFNQPREQRA